MDQLRILFANLAPRARIMLVASVLGTLLVTFLLFQMATRPSFSTLMTGLDPADTGKLTAALDERGIPYKLENNGTAIAVDAAQSAPARVALAEKGLANRGQPGYEIFDNQKLGTSDFQQKINYQRALEGEIAGTIQQVSGVSGAKVQLVLPTDELFADESSPATAAVLLSGDSSALDPGAVRGISQLVSSSVKGLKADKVSITDESGRLLWPSGDGGGTGVAGASGKQAAEARYSQAMETSLNAMLVRTLGPDKAQVKVTPRLNVDKASEEQLTYAKKGTALQERKEDERLQGSGATAGGAAGTRRNIPSYAQSGAAGGDSDYRHRTTDTKFGVNKTVTRREIAPGQVERLDVALLVNKTVPPGELTALEDAVKSAAGIDPARGDTLAVSQVTFAKVAEPKLPSPLLPILGYLKYAGLGLATLLFLVFVRRHLRRRESDVLAEEPRWLREFSGSASLAELEHAQAVSPTRRIPEPTASASRQQLQEIAEAEPERVAAQVRNWIREG